jgi:hypothetical protein
MSKWNSFPQTNARAQVNNFHAQPYAYMYDQQQPIYGSSALYYSSYR